MNDPFTVSPSGVGYAVAKYSDADERGERQQGDELALGMAARADERRARAGRTSPASADERERQARRSTSSRAHDGVPGRRVAPGNHRQTPK